MTGRRYCINIDAEYNVTYVSLSDYKYYHPEYFGHTAHPNDQFINEDTEDTISPISIGSFLNRFEVVAP